MGSRDKIMKYICLCLSFFLIACAQARDGTEMKQPVPLQDDQGLVYYFGFKIERITGIPEHQIEEYGCLYKINREDFEKSLLPDTEATKSLRYNKLDVRAKVVFAKKHYFIDRAGVVSTGTGYGLLDKKKFVSHLTLIRKCSAK